MQTTYFGGERGIRTPVPSFLDHPISSRRRYDRFGISPKNRNILTQGIVLFLFFILTACAPEFRQENSENQENQEKKEELVVLMRPDILSYLQDEEGNISGFDADFMQSFADFIHRQIRFLVVGHEHLEDFLKDGDFHIAASWLSPSFAQDKNNSQAIFLTQDILLLHEDSPDIQNVNELNGQTLYVMAGSRQAQTARRLKENLNIEVVEFMQGDLLDLADLIAQNKVHYAIVDEKMTDLLRQYFPQLKTGIMLSEAAPIVFVFHPQTPDSIKNALNDFLKQSRQNGFLAQLEERYLGHAQRLNTHDVAKFLHSVETILPRYRAYFEEAAQQNNLDWQLLAALAYQESQWNPFATSYTQVRGMMMLTESTAAALKVKDRLNARESILAGAKYLNQLKNRLPAEIEEPDRTYLALSSYNLGFGALSAGRRLAKSMNENPNQWQSMKKILPLLARPLYAKQAGITRARGGEAVILVDNVRAFLDLLNRALEQKQPKKWLDDPLKQTEKTHNIAQELAKIKAEDDALERAFSRLVP